MSWFGWLWSSTEEVKPLHLKVLDVFTQRIFDAFKNVIPNLEKRLEDTVERRAKEINDQITEENVTKLMDTICDDIEAKIVKNLQEYGSTIDPLKRLREIRAESHQKAKMDAEREERMKEVD